MVTQGATEGSNWCCISPTSPEVILLLVRPGGRSLRREPVAEEEEVVYRKWEVLWACQLSFCWLLGSQKMSLGKSGNVTGWIQLLLVVRQPKNEHRDVWERNWVKNQLVRQPKSEPREVWEYINSAGTYLNIQGVCDQLFLYQVINLTNHCQPFIHRVIECPHIRGPVGMTQSPFEGKEARKHLA